MLRSALLTSLLAGLSLAGVACAPVDDSPTESGEGRLVGSIDSIKASTELDSWSQKIAAKVRSTPGLEQEGYTECAGVVEITGAYLCGSSSTTRMNEAMARASLYAEGGFDSPKNTVVSLKSSPYRQGVRMFGGHDIRSEHLLAFWKDVQTECESKGPDFCANPQEKDLFENYIVPMSKREQKFVVITFSLSADAHEVVSHEILHAQYFLQPAFAAATDSFWATKVTAADKATVSDALASYYDVNDDLLLKNEFMAYVLMPGAESRLLASVVPTYRAPLTAALAEKGAAPLEVR